MTVGLDVYINEATVLRESVCYVNDEENKVGGPRHSLDPFLVRGVGQT
jgi:hypothetical protein